MPPLEKLLTDQHMLYQLQAQAIDYSLCYIMNVSAFGTYGMVHSSTLVLHGKVHGGGPIKQDSSTEVELMDLISTLCSILTVMN